MLYQTEAQFFWNEEFMCSRTFDSRMDPTRGPRELAIAWAEEERKADGGVRRREVSLKIGRLQACFFRDLGHHRRANFLIIVKGKDVVRPAGALQSAMGTR
jgi:hypothetical protein